MITTYIRSSSYNAHDLCNHKFFIEYVLGHRFPSNKKADIGNMSHKALELMASAVLAQKQGKNSIKEDIIGEVPVADILNSPKHTFDLAKKILVTQTPHHQWFPYDYEDAFNYFQRTINYNNRLFDPRQRNVIATESRFDIPIDELWSHYSFKVGDEVIQGNLHIKGTIDLIFEENTDTLELFDLKTGKTTTFPEGEEKSYVDVANDIQFLLYHYAAKQLFPEYKYFISTVFYAQFNKPFTVAFSDEDINKCKTLLRQKFEKITNTQKTTLHKGWWCKYVCGAGVNKIPDTEQTYCEFYENENKTKTADEIFIARGDLKMIQTYGDGGGKRN